MLESFFNLPRVTRRIIAANMVVFAMMYFTPFGRFVYGLGVMQVLAVSDGQVWRIFTATYLHAEGLHIFFNMCALYFLGPVLEEMWGERKFFIVYTVCGLAGTIMMIPASMMGFLSPAVIVLGASGCVLGLLGALAVLRPNDIIILLVFPMRVRNAAILLTVVYAFNIISQGWNHIGDLCHLAGLTTGALLARREVYY